jgi:hypothetical protein
MTLLRQLMRIGCRERQAKDPLQLSHFGEGRLGKRRLALEGVQDDALEQVAEGKIERIRQRLEHLQHPLFDADAGLDALDDHGCL